MTSAVTSFASQPSRMTSMIDGIDHALFARPAIRLAGTVDQAMYDTFRSQLDGLPDGPICITELTTLGGDPEFARAMGQDICLRSAIEPDRRFAFVGKAAVYSAGATLMSFFAVQNRFFHPGTRLMIHERSFDCNVTLSGPLSACVAPLRAKLHEVEESIRIQNEGFANLIAGSSVSPDEITERAACNWYLDAQEAQQLGLVNAII